MHKLTRADLLPLETYAAQRDALRKHALAHKRARTLHLGDHVTLLFEDAITKHNVPPGQLTLHADRGGPMKAKSTALTGSSSQPCLRACFRTF